jgi:uncharacterized lipoprotein YajG
MKRLAICLIVAALLIAGCQNKPDMQGSAALAALKSPNPDEKYGVAFWNDQFQRKTEVWQQALAFCTTPDHRLLINCGPVQAVAAPKIPFSSTMPSNGPQPGLLSTPSTEGKTGP